MPSLPFPFASEATPPSEASAPPYAGSFGPVHPPPFPSVASSAPAPRLEPAVGVSGPIRNTRRTKAKVSKPTKKSVEKPLKKPLAKLTGTIPRPRTPEATLNAAGELVLVCPVGQHYCDFVQQKADRPVDMRRHLNAHFPPASGEKTHFCNGRPVDEFPQDIFAALPEDLREIRADGDVDFVGGCGKGYTRPDSLMRHLNKCRCMSKVYCTLVDLDDGSL